MRLLLLAPLAALAACATTPSAPNTREARMTGSFDYMCGSQPAQLTFDNEAGTATLVMDGQQQVMGRQASRSGFIYQNPSTHIMGNGKQLQITGPAGQLSCVMR